PRPPGRHGNPAPGPALRAGARGERGRRHRGEVGPPSGTGGRDAAALVGPRPGLLPLERTSFMKANCWFGTGRLGVVDVPDPKVLNPRDAVVRITLTAICGSDLHLWDGFVPAMEPGDILGHEFMGEVVEVGSAVKN